MKMADYAYHGTSERGLLKIMRAGLLPKRQPVKHSDEERAVKEAVIFFTPLERMAMQWGEIVLRFPWPEDFKEDWYGDAVMPPDGSIVHSSYYTADGILPEDIQLKIGSRWRRITK